MRRAEALDRHYADTGGGTVGPLHGVPCTVKDHFAVKGYPVTMGVTRVRRIAEAPGSTGSKEDCSIVATLRDAGAIIFAKTTMTQLGDTWGGGSPAFGDSLNPWNTLRTTGGSSCGEGALLGSGGSAFGFGSDVGGSVRIPAAFCGLAGLKPTAARVTFSLENGRTILNKPGDYGIMASAGPMARRVSDLVEVCSVLWDQAGRLRVANPSIPPVPFNAAAYTSTTPLRIGFYVGGEYAYPNPHPSVARAVHEAVAALTAQGHTCVPFKPESEHNVTVAELRGAMYGMMALGFSGGGGGDGGGSSCVIDGAADGKGVEVSAAVKRLPAEKSGDPHFAVAARDRLRDKFGQAWRKDGLDAVVCPVFPCPAPRVEEVRELTWAIQSTQIFNFLDYAAGVVPVTKVTAQDCAGDDYDPGTDDAGLSDAMKRTRVGSEGLPVAVQVVAS
eukprot:gene3787-7518_t